MDIKKLRHQINEAQKQVDVLQTQYRATTGHNYNGPVGAINYDHEFEHEDDMWIRFNYVPACYGYGSHPDEPEEIEVVQIVFHAIPLFVSQEKSLMQKRRDEIIEACWAHLKAEGEIPVEERKVTV